MDGTLNRWSRSNGELMATFKTQNSAVGGVLQLNNNTFISSSDEVVQVWNLQTAECIKSFTLDSPISRGCIVKGTNDDIFVCGSKSGSLKVYSNSNFLSNSPPECISEFNNNCCVSSLLMLRDNVIISGSMDGTIREWKMGVSEPIQTFMSEHDQSNIIQQLVELYHYSSRRTTVSSGVFIASAAMNVSVIRIWSLRSGEEGKATCIQELICAPDETRIRSIVELSDGTIVCGTQDGVVQMWSEYGECLSTDTDASNPVSQIVALKDGSIGFARGKNSASSLSSSASASSSSGQVQVFIDIRPTWLTRI